MKMNVFEGARRIALFFAALSVVGTIIATVVRDPYVPVMYNVVIPALPPKMTTNDCPANAGRHYFSAKTSQGKSVPVTLCMLAMPFDNGAQLIPFRSDEKGMWWGNGPYSEEVKEYGQRLEQRFQLAPADEKLISEKISAAFWGSVQENAKYLCFGLFIFWLLVYAVGWIVRGFFGIPQGADRKRD
jgi:hypothetical protein